MKILFNAHHVFPRSNWCLGMWLSYRGTCNTLCLSRSHTHTVAQRDSEEAAGGGQRAAHSGHREGSPHSKEESENTTVTCQQYSPSVIHRLLHMCTPPDYDLQVALKTLHQSIPITVSRDLHSLHLLVTLEEDHT